MRILFCTNSLGAKGGIEKVTIVKANTFADMEGVEVAVAFTDRGTYPHDLIHPLSPKVRVIDLGVPFWDLYPLNFKNLLVVAPRKFSGLRKAIKRAIVDFRPDIVVTTGTYEKYALATIRPSKLLRKPSAKVREYHFNSNYRKLALRKSAIGAIAETIEDRMFGWLFDMNYLLTREDWEKNFKGRKKFDYQHNPVTYTAGDRIPMSGRDKTVAVVCRLTHQKNVPATIRAWAAIKDHAPEWKLRIVGDGEDRRELEELTRQLDATDSVEFMGFRKDVPEILSHSRILAVTARYDGLSLNIVEAMAAGTVPVSYRTPYGPTDVITDGVDGVLVDYMDEGQMATALLHLIQDEERTEAMSTKAVERARDFSTEKIAVQWMEKYKALLIKN